MRMTHPTRSEDRCLQIVDHVVLYCNERTLLFRESYKFKIESSRRSSRSLPLTTTIRWRIVIAVNDLSHTTKHCSSTETLPGPTGSVIHADSTLQTSKDDSSTTHKGTAAHAIPFSAPPSRGFNTWRAIIGIADCTIKSVFHTRTIIDSSLRPVFARVVGFQFSSWPQIPQNTGLRSPRMPVLPRGP
jgi:hypothetical protein